MRKWLFLGLALVPTIGIVLWIVVAFTGRPPAPDQVGDAKELAAARADLRCPKEAETAATALPFPWEFVSQPGEGPAPAVSGEPAAAGAAGQGLGTAARPASQPGDGTPTAILGQPGAAIPVIGTPPPLGLSTGPTDGVGAAPGEETSSFFSRMFSWPWSGPDYTILNDPPTACAGGIVAVMAGDLAQLGGEGSFDPDDDPLTYYWRITSRPEGSLASLEDPDAASTVLKTDAPGFYRVSLIVNDRIHDSAPDMVLVFASPWFIDVTQAAGVQGGGAQNFQEGYGPGAAWGDYDGDEDPDLYVTRDGPNLLYRNNGDGTFTEVAAQAGVDSHLNSYGAAWADYDNDGDLDLYVVNHGADQEGDLGNVPDQPNALYRNNGDGTFTDVASEAGVDFQAHGIGAVWTDIDSDGWIDLYVTNLGVLGYPQGKTEADLLLRNRADGTFVDIGESAGVWGGPAALVRTDQTLGTRSGLSFEALWFDYDGDGDPDLFVTDESGVSPLYRNNGDGTFTDVTPGSGLLVSGRARGAVSGDYDNDGDPDLFVTSSGGSRLWSNDGDGTFTDVTAAAGLSVVSRDWGAGFIDFDSDGHLDIYVVSGPSGRDEANQPSRLYRNNGDGTFKDVTALAAVGNDGAARAVAFADYDGDGYTDIYVVNADGANVLYKNEIGKRSNWFGVRLLGSKSNLNGIGAKVEVTTLDGVTRTASPSGGSGYLGQDGTDLLFGLGTLDRADLKVTWPSGVVQEFWDIWGNDLGKVREGTMEGSCPLVFAWDGSRYAFVSDVLGSAVTGFALGPDVYRFPIDTDEYLKIEDVEPRDGLYSIKIVELLNEIIYVDHARLLVVDHPSSVDVYPNERLKLFPPFPEPGIVVVKNARPPVAATDENGNDILEKILKRDGIYVEGFDYLPYEGFARQHSIVLDLGDLSGAERVLLVLSGWTHYVTSSAVSSAAADGVGPMLPVLEVLNESGEWTPVTMDMGFPAGQPKTITYDMTGKFLTDQFKVRITTNLQIFWDQVLVSTDAEEATPRVSELRPVKGDLHWKGYPRLLAATGDRGMYPAAYDYNVVDVDRERWVVPEGSYTRYGDVIPLLDRIDDKFAVMRNGDELTLEFGADGLPELPQGWSRSVILYLDGFLKYVDPFVAHGSSVAPLPFHSMSGYPYPPEETYPQDEAHQRYLREYNSRTFTASGNPSE